MARGSRVGIPDAAAGAGWLQAARDRGHSWFRHDVQRLAAHVAPCSDELRHEIEDGTHRHRQRAARYARASFLAREQEDAAPWRHRWQNPMLQRVVRAASPARKATEADRGHHRQDAIPCQHAGVLALVRKASEVGHCRPRKASFRDRPFARLVRHASGKIDGVKRLPWRGTHIMVLPY